MSNKAIKPITYSSIEQKNILEKEMFKALSPSDNLIHTLDMMDLFVSMTKERPYHPEDDEYSWIILKLKK
jgi:hypothetical protein